MNPVRVAARIVVVAVLTCGGSADRAAAVNGAFTYQGQVVLNGTPVDGTCDFRFGLFDDPVAGNGYPCTGCMENHSAVPVSNGLFSIRLNTNDFFTDVDSIAFDGGDRWLEIQVKCPSGQGTYTTLSPREQVTATPYALLAEDLACVGCVGNGDLASNAVQGTNIAASTITGAKIAAATLTGSNIASSTIAGSHLAAATVTGAKIASNTVTGSNLANATVTGAKLANATVTGANIASATITGSHIANGSIGDLDFSLPLNLVDSSAATTLQISNNVSGSGGALFAAGGTYGVRGSSNQGGHGVWGNGSGTGNGVLGFGDNGAGVQGNSTNSYGGFFTSTNGAGLIAAGANNTKPDLVLSGTASNDDGVISSAPDVAGSDIFLRSNDAVVIELDNDDNEQGQLEVRDTSGRVIVSVQEPSGAQNVVTVDATPGDNSGILVMNDSATRTTISAQNFGTSDYYRAYNESGTAVFRVTDSGRVVTTALQITGGGDLGEKFRVHEPGPVEPGTLMVIDEGRPGALKASTQPYDTRVAGIVSGANGVNPGMTLEQEGVLDGDITVALAGRVYVKADAQTAPIKPGDLLTTSALPGVAMKASDRTRAPGATIGKAMTGLEEGTGLVLVLVSLQ